MTSANNKTPSAKTALKLTLLAASIFGSAAPALAQGASSGDVVVTGRRVSEASVAIGTDRPTATVSITREALLSAPAGVTGLKMLESLPGFNVQANDALGMYEFGNSVSVRAFNFQQIGFLLDDIPMGRSDQFGGSPIYRYVDNENLLRVTASAGAGDVSLPSYSSLGPIVDYFTQAPSEEFGATVSQTFGSDDLKRTFARLESGEIAGFSGYVSGSGIKGDLWRGPGYIDRKHYEGKLRYRFGDGDVTFQTVHNDYFDYDSPAITLAQYRGTAGDIFGRAGRGFAYLETVPPLPETAPGVRFSNTAYNQHYKFAVNSREDHLYGLSLNTPITSGWTIKATAYYEDKDGYGVSPEAYATSLNSHNAQRLIVSGLTPPRGLQYGLSTVNGTRKGFVGKSFWTLGAHEVAAGVWIETDDYHRTQARYNTVGGDPDGAPLLNQPVHLQRNYISYRDTLSFFLKDTISLLGDKLKIDIGAKALDIDYRIDGVRNPGDYIARRNVSIADKWEDWLLPQVGAVYAITPRDQIFVSYSENMALPRGADDIFSAASPAAPGPQAETAKNWEIGVRTNRPSFNASLVAYHTAFENRLQSFAAPVPGSTTTETFFQNVGAVEASGAEFSGQWKPGLLGGRVFLNTNLSYNKSEFQDNYSTLSIKGKTVPDFPEFVAQGGVTVEAASWLVFNVSARRISSRYTNFLNTEQLDGYTILNAYIDVGGDINAGPLKGLKLRLNGDNITDENYLGTINTTTSTPASFRPGPPQTLQLTLTADF